MATSLSLAAGTLASCLSIWYLAVNNEVTKPYLDEVFHDRQAKHYCNGDWHIWDDKITTPPGLYLISTLLSPIIGCSTASLRFANVICLSLLFVVVYIGYLLRRKANRQSGSISRVLALHSSLNTVLFPPLFFFSALYYTDVASTLSVFLFHAYLIHTFPIRWNKPHHAVVLVLLGVHSLLYRQTNIFWVAIAPAGLVLIAALDQGHAVVKDTMHRRVKGFGDSFYSIAKTSWKYSTVFDPPVRDAWFEDYLRTIVSLVACAVKAVTSPSQIMLLIELLYPFLAILASFVGFIVWNGSVVLGDKSNHITTLNFPQILYYWPYVTFFSWPLLLPYLMLAPVIVISRLGSLAHIEPLIFFKRSSFFPRLSLLAGFTLLALALVHFNTIVHPFILADNRHYVFYIFKLLLRPWWVRYAVSPVYILCAWACIEARGEAAASPLSKPEDGSENKDNKRKENSDEKDSPSKESPRLSLRLPDGVSSVRTSFILVQFATTALQICTAPLVEPRYYIVPWMVWRMSLPLRSDESHISKKDCEKGLSLAQILEGYDYRVIVETLWFLLVNAITGYIFLNWKFTWLSEPLTPMRFMW